MNAASALLTISHSTVRGCSEKYRYAAPAAPAAPSTPPLINSVKVFCRTNRCARRRTSSFFMLWSDCTSSSTRRKRDSSRFTGEGFEGGVAADDGGRGVLLPCAAPLRPVQSRPGRPGLARRASRKAREGSMAGECCSCCSYCSHPHSRSRSRARHSPRVHGKSKLGPLSEAQQRSYYYGEG